MFCCNEAWMIEGEQAIYAKVLMHIKKKQPVLPYLGGM
jgi:hypothetical protein